MIGTFVLYGLAVVGALSILSCIGVLVFTWRLPESTDPGVIDVQREYVAHARDHREWRNNVRPIAPTTLAGADVRYIDVRDRADVTPDGAA